MTRPIHKLLIANRGEIARRVMRTCRELGIGTVAVFSDPDAKAPFVGEADEALRLPGAAPADTYLRADLLVAAALRSGADAVHPGYGFLAESAAFAQACLDAGLLFVGPSPQSIAAMGDKAAARELMQERGVPVLPGRSLRGLEFAQVHAAGAAVGYPLLVKAVAGGGGRGLRLVRDRSELQAAVESAGREAEAAFGDGALLLERHVGGARHVEVQVFGDHHGNVVALHERECSIQRRHQKLLEECPSPAVDPRLRAALSAAAVAAARAVDYVGAGTVEFLLGPDRSFHFLEMNTRLQVEHPVTEEVTGLDLVRLQLQVAMGDPLPGEALRPRLDGHAIEVRLYAEDPLRDFLPATGTIHAFALRPGPGLRVESAVEAGSEVGAYYDGLLAKLIVHAPSRGEAARRLAAALQGLRLHGIVNNRDFLVRLLRHPEFLQGASDTQFLERHSPAVLGAPLVDAGGERLHALAAALCGAAARRAASPLAFAPSGFRNNASQPQRASFETRHGRIEVTYLFDRDGIAASVDGIALRVQLHACDAALADLEIDGVRRRYQVSAAGGLIHVDSPLGHSALTETERFPLRVEAPAAGSLLAPLPGTVRRVAVALGETVEAGALVVLLEAMKMEHRVVAPRAGQVAELRVREGDRVESGALLATLEDA